MYKNWVGIIGNVGPEVDEILQKYIRLEMNRRGASKDHDYLRMLVVKNPDISDRTAAILNNDKSPLNGFLETCSILENNNIFYAALPSNTSHYFYDDIQSKTDVYIINLLDIVSKNVRNQKIDRIGILCTTPTKETEIYTKSFQKYGVRSVYPSQEIQEDCVQSAIYGTKHGKSHQERLNDGLKSGNNTVPLKKISSAVTELIDKENCNAVLLGCTEIPIISEQLKNAFPQINFIDPLQILAENVIEIYMAIEDKLKKPESINYGTNISSINNVNDVADSVIAKLSFVDKESEYQPAIAV